jgi:GNAT superfamily N-acetyltransferase
MTTIDVRQAVLADLEDLSKLFDQYRQFQGRPGDIQAAREFLRARFDHGESVVFMARDHGTPVGMAQLFPIFSSVALARVFILNDLFVCAAGRRKGVASQLLAAVENHAWLNNAARISLNVAISNRQGQALYEARGWQKDSEFFMYHRFPAGH